MKIRETICGKWPKKMRLILFQGKPKELTRSPFQTTGLLSGIWNWERPGEAQPTALS